ncbi:hypothetical protein ACMGD3_24270 [Lysinibacillus sphaericus]|uniref:hypothetical protein n=1 Tax=Lysinibacillus sphaericus TaxID=1421 RepID=UPI003F793970
MQKDLMLAEIFSDVVELKVTINKERRQKQKIIKIDTRDTNSVVAALDSLDVVPVDNMYNLQKLTHKKNLHTMADNISSQVEALRRHV